MNVRTKCRSLLYRGKSAPLKVKFNATSVLNRDCWLLPKVYTTSNLRGVFVREKNGIKKINLLRENQRDENGEKKKSLSPKPKSLSSIYRITFQICYRILIHQNCNHQTATIFITIKTNFLSIVTLKQIINLKIEIITNGKSFQH